MPNNHFPTPQEMNIEFKESLIESLKEVELMHKGKLPKRSWREMIKEIKEELHSE